VVDENGNGIRLPRVTVANLRRGGIYEAFARDDGRFLVGKLGVGRYQVYAEEQQSGVGLTQSAVVPGSEIELVLPETSSVPSSR
jgi:hypothetical protein